MVEFGAVDAVNLCCILSLGEGQIGDEAANSVRGSRCCSHTFTESDCPVQCTYNFLSEHSLLFLMTASFQIRSQKLLEEEAIFLTPHYLFVSDKEREIICGLCV